MKRMKLFPKTFFYTLGLMLFVAVTAHVLIYLLAPQMYLEVSVPENAAEDITLSVAEEKVVMQAVQKALPFSLACCLLISVFCSLLFSRAISGPIKSISASTARMMKLDRAANCRIHSKDEIGILAQNVNELYSGLLSTIERLEREKDTVHELERAKTDFLRAASHELKTPVTALNATLENMILGVGKYKDYDAYLPQCKEMTERLAEMIQEILEISKLEGPLIREAPVKTDLSSLLTWICEPYEQIARARGTFFEINLSDGFSAELPTKMFSKAVSNILANAVAYTEAGKTISIYFDGSALTVENECVPIPDDALRHAFEPFYRPDYARNREEGGNGLGLYIVDTLLKAMGLSYSFRPMTQPMGMRFTIWF